MPNTIRDTPIKRPAANTTRVNPAPEPETVTHAQIAARAHELYVKSGRQHGRDVEFWLEAERQLIREEDV